MLRNGGTILPAGGLDHGQKGYSWALLVEALTQGLAGFGRADSPMGWGACAYVEVIDPTAFAGKDAFTRQTEWLANSIRQSAPRAGNGPVRLPGQQACARRREALANGVALYPGVLEALQPRADRFAVATPDPLM